MDKENGKDQELSKQLWRCNCSNGGVDTNPDYHESKCHYVIWYNAYFFDEEE